MDIHIDFEDRTCLWVRNVIKRDVGSDNYHVWFVKNNKVCEKIFKTKQIKCVSVHKVIKE